MDTRLEIAIKVGISALLSFAGNTLEESGNVPLGKALNLASVAFSGWAVKDMAALVAQEHDTDHAV